jgi:hypothetical protein
MQGLVYFCLVLSIGKPQGFICPDDPECLCCEKGHR